MDFSGKVALVTGASSGIGRATVQILAKYGAKVVINYASNDEKAMELMDGMEKKWRGSYCNKRKCFSWNLLKLG